MGRTIAYRAACRVVPHTRGSSKEQFIKLVRALLICRAGSFKYSSSAAFAMMDSESYATRSCVEAVSSWTSNRKLSLSHVLSAVSYASQSVFREHRTADEFWHAVESDLAALNLDKNHPSLFKLWPNGHPKDYIERCTDFSATLSDYGSDWWAISSWIDSNIIGQSGREHILDRERELAKKSVEWWSRDADVVAADIARLGIHKIPVGDGLSKDRVQSDAKPNTPSNADQNIGRQILAKRVVVKKILSGLSRSCDLERAQVASEKPNSDDKKEEQKQKLIFLDKLKSGLDEIHEAIETEPSSTVVESINETLQGLEDWYLKQPDYVQKSIRVTGVGMTLAGLVAAGASSLLAFPFAACFFAKSEIKEVAELLPKLGKQRD